MMSCDITRNDGSRYTVNVAITVYTINSNGSMCMHAYRQVTNGDTRRPGPGADTAREPVQEIRQASL